MSLGFCPRCGPFSVSGFIEISPGSNVRIENNSTNCPRCGVTAEVVSGDYSRSADGHLQVLIDLALSPEAAQAIALLAKRTSAGKLSPECAQQEAEKIAPGAGKLFDIGDWSDEAKAIVFAALITAATAIYLEKTSPSPQQTINIHPVIERVVNRDKLMSSTSIPSIESPRPPRPKPKPRR